MQTSTFAAIAIGLLLRAMPVNAQVPESFIRNTVPQKYPKLIAFLDGKAPQTVRWKAESGEEQVLTVELSRDRHVIIKTSIFVGTAPTASKMTERTPVTMIDRNLDGRVDNFTAEVRGERPQSIDNPKDEGSTFLWYGSLHIIFRFSPCCPN